MNNALYDDDRMRCAVTVTGTVTAAGGRCCWGTQHTQPGTMRPPLPTLFLQPLVLFLQSSVHTSSLDWRRIRKVGCTNPRVRSDTP
eukprot:257002-Prorocentrum_minimum.AAC.1